MGRKSSRVTKPTKQTPLPPPSTSIPFLQRIIFQTLVFLIPTNLFMALDQSQAHVHGIRIDYLISKLYLSDLLILLLFAAWFIHHPLQKLKKLNPFNLHSSDIRFTNTLILAASLIYLAYSAVRPLPSISFLAKLFQYYLLFIWIRSSITPTHIKIFTKPLLLGLFFQSLVAIIQWIQQSSIIGFLFLGETTLKTTSFVAKTTLGGELRLLPYGTTPHPNVLAGYITISLVILMAIFRATGGTAEIKHFISRFFSNLGIFTIVFLSLIALILTQSITAILTLTISLILLRGKHFHWQNLLALIAIASAIFMITYSTIEATSFSRRLELAQISLKMIAANPLQGVGLNHFTIALPSYGEVAGNIRFLQPVHNIYLLWLAETGLLGTIPLFLICYSNRKHLLSQQNWELKIPLFAILLIGILDHYPLTIQTGQLLFTLGLGLSTLPPQTK